MVMRSRLIVTFLLTLLILLRKSISSFRRRGGEIMNLHACYYEPELFCSKTERFPTFFCLWDLLYFYRFGWSPNKYIKILSDFFYDGPRYLISSQGCCWKFMSCAGVKKILRKNFLKSFWLEDESPTFLPKSVPVYLSAQRSLVEDDFQSHGGTP